MVRKTYTRHNSHRSDIYKHRSSTYVSRSVRGDHIVITNAKPKKSDDSPTSKPIKQAAKTEEPEFKFPPKRPTPPIVLRSDIMPKQRSHNSL